MCNYLIKLLQILSFSHGLSFIGTFNQPIFFYVLLKGQMFFVVYLDGRLITKTCFVFFQRPEKQQQVK